MTPRPLADSSPDPLRRFAGGAVARGLEGPALLFLTSHRPLAFWASQLLHVAAPLAVLFGWRDVAEWAAACEDEARLDRLEQELDHAVE